MIKRIVKMTFLPERVGSFLDIFAENRPRIRHFPGCLHLELWRDQEAENVFFTYSFWESEEDLNNYRRSEVFRSTWTRTRVLFAGPAEAWTVVEIPTGV